jgi:hypothetical protein
VLPIGNAPFWHGCHVKLGDGTTLNSWALDQALWCAGVTVLPGVAFLPVDCHNGAVIDWLDLAVSAGRDNKLFSYENLGGRKRCERCER